VSSEKVCEGYDFASSLKRSPWWKRGKRLKETRLVAGKFPYKLLNGDVALPWWEVNFGKQILISPFWFASLVDF
jgi:hypothetical protein